MNTFENYCLNCFINTKDGFSFKYKKFIKIVYKPKIIWVVLRITGKIYFELLSLKRGIFSKNIFTENKATIHFQIINTTLLITEFFTSQQLSKIILNFPELFWAMTFIVQ